MPPDVIVVGAGVIGSTIAYQLAKRGLRVSVFDRGEAGQATAASAGMLPPLIENGSGPLLGLAGESLRLFLPLQEDLREKTGMDVGYRQTGMLGAALDEAQARRLERQRTAADRAGIKVIWVDSDRASELEPALTRDCQAALFYPDAAQVSAPALARACLLAAVNLGAIVHAGSPVDSLELEGDRVVGVRVGVETMRAAEVILANGAWLSAWSESLHVRLPVRPVRGQLVVLAPRGAGLRHVIFTDLGYLVQKAEGVVYAGATEEDVGFDPRPTADGTARMLALLPRLAPGLTDSTFVRALAGLRPATPDRLPVIGRLPGWAGVTVAAGHFRNGVILAPITAVLVADLVLRQQPRCSLDAFDPGRFLIRAA